MGRRAVKAPVKFGNFASLKEVEAAMDGSAPNTMSTPLADELPKAKRARTNRTKVPKGQAGPLNTPPESPKEATKAVVEKVEKLTQSEKVQRKRARNDELEARPKPYAEPQVWADDRQALCETLYNYRAFQSGAYTSGGLVHGMLLAEDSLADRAYIDEEIVITRAGGHLEMDKNGEMVQKKDQSVDNSQVQCWMRNMDDCHPIIVILSKQNGESAIHPPHEFNVMAYFRVSDCWAELSREGKVLMKQRLEKLDLQKKSWWAVPGTPTPPPNTARDFTRKAQVKSCLSCKKSSKQIFGQGWMCLQPKCGQFYRIGDDKAPEGLTYSADFLAERTLWPTKVPRFGTERENEVELKNRLEKEGAYSRDSWKGIICPRCGRCICREEWSKYVCRSCSFELPIEQRVLSAQEVQPPHSGPMEIANPSGKPEYPTKRTALTFRGDWRITTYELDSENTVLHLGSNEDINKKPNGPDDMFVEIQRQGGCGMMRGELKNHAMGKGRAVASHFARNFGMDYEYVVRTETQSFESAPQPILDALERMTWAGKISSAAKSEEFVPFNELLAVGYFTEGKMSFHDDGEDSLLSMVATLSLGCPATMLMRMKRKYYYGHTKGGNHSDKLDEVVLPGCFEEEKRRALLLRRKDMTTEEYRKARSEMYKGFEKEHGRSFYKNPPPILRMTLYHGDIVIMNGFKMQKYYEHAVMPEGQVRFALTCRQVKPEYVNKEDHWKAAIPTDRAHPYDGDDESQDNPPDLPQISSESIPTSMTTDEAGL